VAVSDVIGIVGLSAGPDVSIVDKLALADPLLAELPLEMPNRWRSGHLPRVIPQGYVHARKTGSLAQMDPPLRSYYRHLLLIVSGPIFDWDRLRTIVNLHLHRYDHLIDQWQLQQGTRQ
jgi:arabinofuranosyltransferase